MKKSFIITSAIFLFFLSSSYATWYNEPAYGFKINVPASWSSNNFQDGTDKVYDFYSPDQNIAIQLRAFESNGQVSTDLLIQVYEENMLPAGTRREMLFEKTSVNGIPGKQGVYSSRYNNMDVTMSAFYAVPNNYGYVLLVIVPTSMMEQKAEEIKEVTHTFFVNGFQAQSSVIQQTKPQSTSQSGSLGGLQGLSGSTAGNSGTSSANVKGVYEFYHRSDRKKLVNYHYIYINDDGTFREEYQPKNSGNYVGKNEGTWKKSGNQVILTHSGGGVKDTYNVESDGFLLKRTTSDGITITFGQK